MQNTAMEKHGAFCPSAATQTHESTQFPAPDQLPATERPGLFTECVRRTVSVDTVERNCFSDTMKPISSSLKLQTRQ